MKKYQKLKFAVVSQAHRHTHGKTYKMHGPFEFSTAIYSIFSLLKPQQNRSKECLVFLGLYLIGYVNRSCDRAYSDFPHSKNSRFQNEAKCKTFVVKMSFICMRIKKSLRQ